MTFKEKVKDVKDRVKDSVKRNAGKLIIYGGGALLTLATIGSYSVFVSKQQKKMNEKFQSEVEEALDRGETVYIEYLDDYGLVHQLPIIK